MKMAPVSSRKLEILPDSSAVKKVSGMQVKVWRDVENLRVNDSCVVIYVCFIYN